LDACTIIAKNYLAHARVLARSFAEHHPDGRMWTLIIDEFARYVDPADEPFEVLTPADIGCEPFTQMAIRYSVLELSTAVKPWLLRHLMQATGRPVTYLDPDIRIYGSLEHLDELARDHGLVLTPHNNEPIPADGRRPSQVDIMISGVYNLGYVSLAPRPEVDGLLDWWADRLVRDCRVDPVWGYFVDQRWFDLAPGFVSELAIVREPEYNVAYWNLHGRRMHHEGGRYLVNGRPLAFFHFSGFDTRHPLVLSRYQDRIDVVHDPWLEQILAEYAAEVNAQGHAVSREWPYSYSAMGDGTQLDNTLRALFDEYAQEHQNGTLLSPFTLQGAKAFEQWLRSPPSDGPPGIDRVLLQVYEDRADLRSAYPNLRGADGQRLLRWVDEHGRREVPLLAQFEGIPAGPAQAILGGSTQEASVPIPAAIEPIGGPMSVRVTATGPLPVDPWGVNVVGSLRSELGVGEAARQIVNALDAKGIPLLPILGQTIPFSRQGHSFVTAEPEEAPFPVNLICINGDLFPEFASQVTQEFFMGRYSIGLWFWDLDRLPDSWQNSFSLLEEVWAPTAHVAGALAPLATVPVTTVRIPVAPPEFERRTRSQLGLPEHEFIFLFSFDYLSGFDRKNPLAVIDAFERAFAPGEGARLVLKCINAERDLKAHAELRARARAHPGIGVIERYMPAPDYNGMIELCDCYVSLHRAEAFGFVIAQAMWFGKPVIATGYSGNLDYMTAENSHLVDYQLTAVPGGSAPYPAGASWADPDVERAAALMRQVFGDRDAARELGARAANDIRETHSPDAAGEILNRRLESIHGTGRARRGAAALARNSPALAELPLQIREGPARLAPRDRGRARELLRTAALRTMRPFTVYQRSIDEQVVAALEELSIDAMQLRREDAGKRAVLMAELRRYEQLPSVVAEHGRRMDEIKRRLTLQTDRSLYLAVAELQRRHAAIAADPGEPPQAGALQAFELRAFSQNGEDGVLAEILRRTGAPKRFFVEFGVESGREGNCVYLADIAGWRGLFMEAEDEDFQRLEHKYSGNGRVKTVQAKVTPETIVALLAHAEVPSEPDVLSIDVDGQDYWIWSAVEGYAPRIVVIEYNSALDPRRRLVQPNEPDGTWDGTEFFGASVGALRSLGEGKGYRLVHTELSGANAFFVREDLVGDAFPAADEIAITSVPNYFQSGYRHPPASPEGRYLDLDTQELTSGDW
jgi:glycosyltransferase involved in cell wall biosynthesis